MRGLWVIPVSLGIFSEKKRRPAFGLPTFSGGWRFTSYINGFSTDDLKLGGEIPPLRLWTTMTSPSNEILIRPLFCPDLAVPLSSLTLKLLNYPQRRNDKLLLA